MVIDSVGLGGFDVVVVALVGSSEISHPIHLAQQPQVQHHHRHKQPGGSDGDVVLVVMV